MVAAMRSDDVGALLSAVPVREREKESERRKMGEGATPSLSRFK